ncbi:M48 family metallopeptidase [Halarcobacter ebronensis]|uniref:Peptidase M48 family protein n=1 Tax=Halarcobacter ebronensis TaxID=1462615 RepID=A0A4Q1AUT1_9BACT|nr:M48 family metallopeptidase [Halarcobacter ebronensis]QKF81617.1 peptidase, M48 family [Halarcobacter ebronensis]RXK05543.1 peptidase M48 family protein [Halarcobacter ebronensis]
MYKKVILIIITIFFIGCNSKAPVTNRDQLILISQTNELALGEQSYKEVLKNSEVINNTVDAKRVKEIGRKIANIVDRTDYKWEFNLVKNEEKNAFCLPGGKVVVYTGILKVAKNDDQLATVISHEIAHALARHGAERMTTGLISQGVQLLGNIILSTQASHVQSTFNVAYGLGSQYGVVLPYSRMQENEADEIGIHLMFQAGFNIYESLNFWENMSKDSNQSNEFFSTHPSSQTRIENIKRIIKELEDKEGKLPPRVQFNESLGKRIY